MPPRDTAALAAAISHFCEQPQVRQKYAEAAMDRVRSLYEQKQVVEGYIEYFNNLFRK